MRLSFVEFVGGVDSFRQLASEMTIDEAIRGTGFERSCVRKLAQKHRIRFMRRCKSCLKSKQADQFNKSASVCVDCRTKINQRPAGNAALWRTETAKFQYSMMMLKKPWSNAKGPLNYWRQHA